MARGLSHKLRLDEDHVGSRRKRRPKQIDWLHRIDVADFLETLNVNNLSQATADEMLFSCPFSGHSSGDSKPSAYMNDGSKEQSKATMFKCHGCGRQGNAITFYAEHENVSKSEATRVLREQYAPDYRAPKGGSISAEFEMRRQKLAEEAESEPDEMPTIEWDHYWDLFQREVDWYEAQEAYEQDEDPPEVLTYMARRGFLPSTLEDWAFGYDIYTDRITIPIVDINGNLVGVKARTWKPKNVEKMKYLILGDREGRNRYGFTHYEKARVVFGLDRIRDDETVVFVEGELDVVALWQLGIPAISTGSAALSEEQALLIRDRCGTVILFLDQDEAGTKATWGFEKDDGEWKPGIVELLEPFMHVKIVDGQEDDPAGYLENRKVDELKRLIDTAVAAHRWA